LVDDWAISVSATCVEGIFVKLRTIKLKRTRASKPSGNAVL